MILLSKEANIPMGKQILRNLYKGNIGGYKASFPSQYFLGWQISLEILENQFRHSVDGDNILQDVEACIFEARKVETPCGDYFCLFPTTGPWRVLWGDHTGNVAMFAACRAQGRAGPG